MRSSILARIPGFRQRIIPEPSFPSQGSQARGTRLVPVSQEIRPPRRFAPPLKRGGDIPRIFAPPGANLLGISPPRGANLLGISPPFRNFAPPYEFCELQVENIYCVIYLFITRRQNYIHILGFLAAGGVHSWHNHSFEVLRLVSYSTHLKWNHCPQRSHKIMLSYSSGSLHSHNIL